MKTQEQIKDRLLVTEQEYTKLRKAGELTQTKRIRLQERIEILKWVVDEPKPKCTPEKCYYCSKRVVVGGVAMCVDDIKDKEGK